MNSRREGREVAFGDWGLGVGARDLWWVESHAGATPERERLIARVVVATARELGAEILQMGGMPDHIHIHILVPSTVTVVELVKRLH